MDNFQLKRLGQIMAPEPGNPMEAEGVLNPGAVRGVVHPGRAALAQGKW